MIENPSEKTNESNSLYPILDQRLPFSDYIARCRTIIQNRRTDLKTKDAHAELILNANSPFEFYPDTPVHSGERLKYGVLLIHGLLDCPFSLRDIGTHLQQNGMLCRSILLPGHGTTPADLLSVSYQDWIQAVRYGVESMRDKVEKIYLVGYSTGATLSIYQAMQDPGISGIILLAPAIRIKAPIGLMTGWSYVKKWLGLNHNLWLSREPEIDYTKYLSIAFNPVTQVALLTEVLKDLRRQHSLACPVFMAVSREDETISSHKAIDFFANLPNATSKLLVYSSYDHRYPDPRIATRMTQYPDLHIHHFSHVSLPFSPQNPHYGQHGDYEYASQLQFNQFIYGAYNRIEAGFFAVLYYLKLLKNPRRELTYNPDFDYMAKQITQFILSSG